MLCGGLAVTVPFALAVVWQNLSAGAREAMAAGNLPAYPEWIGLVGGFLAYELKVFGPVGEGLVALGALSALTLVTVGWNPLGALRKKQPIADSQEPKAKAGVGPVEGVIEEVIEQAGNAEAEEPAPPRRKKRARKAGGSEGTEGTERTGAARPVPEEELPPIDLLNPPAPEAAGFESELDRQQAVLIDTLRQFKVDVTPGGRTTGPVVTQFEVVPAAGVKVGRIAALADDLALTMKAQAIRIVAPIPGKGAVGVEVPNPTPRLVGFRELLETAEWRRAKATLPIALGRDIEGRPIIADLAKMPHLLIAGTTGSGKSVGLNAMLLSLMYKSTPEHVRLIMIDPKMLELAVYDNIPHLLIRSSRSAPARAIRQRFSQRWAHACSPSSDT